MIEKIFPFALSFSVDFVILMLGLSVMLRLQKLPFNFLGLVATAIICSGVDIIPYVGHYLAVLALYICLMRLTHADLFPDLIFTVGLPYAMVVCFNLYVLGAFMGDLRAMVRARVGTPTQAVAQTADPAPSTRGVSLGALKYITTFASWFRRTPAASLDQLIAIPSTNQSTNLLAGTNAPEPAPVKLVDPAALKLASEVARNFSLKGVNKSPSEAMAIIFTGVKNYTIAEGESLQMDTAKGRIKVRCTTVEERRVVLDVSGIDVVILRRPSNGGP